MNEYRQEVAIHQISETDHLHGLRAGVVVPISQALVTGILVWIITALVFYKQGAQDWYFWATIFAVLVIFGQWLFGLAIWQRLIRLVELHAQVDIDQDGMVGEPAITQTAPTSVRVEFTESSGGGFGSTAFIDLPYPDRLPALASGLISGRGFTVANWVGQSRGRLFTPGEFVELRGIFLDHKWIAPNNPHDETRGYSLTKAGAAVMRNLSPSPTHRNAQNKP